MQPDVLAPSDTFARRHIGPDETEVTAMLSELGYKSLADLTAATVPAAIRLQQPLQLGEPFAEHELLEQLQTLASDNHVLRSFIGQGYYDTITPGVILRNVLENPGWYTQYTPYQAEISQGRLEALINFQQMIEDLTGLGMANASLLDEATAAAEAMHMCFGQADHKRAKFWVHDATHPQTIAVMQTRAEPLGIELAVGSLAQIEAGLDANTAGVLISYPSTDGQVIDHRALCAKIHAAGAYAAMATDLLALTLVTPPGELGADIAVGTAQRFGVPMGFGGPHAAFLSTTDAFRRQVPGRIIGVSRDNKGKTAFRLALQTREQHIRREKATSNICTAQVLLAVMASMYAVYHGPEGLTQIAKRVRAFTALAAAGLAKHGIKVRPGVYFDTLRVDLDAHQQASVLARAVELGLNLRRYDDGVGISCDETTTLADLGTLLEAFSDKAMDIDQLVVATTVPELPVGIKRTSAFLTHPTFARYHSEHEMLRYINRLCAKDLSLTTSMIPLGSCTMKLNATSEMIPVTWSAIGGLHPFAPAEQWGGYRALFERLEAWLGEITGLPAVSLQPNSGAQGEYAGLLAIRGYHRARNEHHRNICLIPTSAHGTNPASAVMAGMQVVVIASLADGTIDLADLRKKAEQYRHHLSCLMVTYPSTHGVFEEGIREVCEIVHAHGGQVYMDGANMNAQVGLTRPAAIGADVCHLNLHKTFCLEAGTQVALPNGVTRPIEDLVAGSAVYGWSESEDGVRPAQLVAKFHTGRKTCVTITLQDGRTITCTPDHRVRTTEGWVEAGDLVAAKHRIVMGPDLPVDVSDAEAESGFRVDYAGLVLAMDTAASRERALAFFRILGATCSDGTFSRSEERGRMRERIRLYFGTRLDAERALDDIELLTGARPAISTADTLFGINLPVGLVSAIASMPGMGQAGKKIDSARTIPDVIAAPATPVSVIREFIAALFGGDGCAPTIVHLVKAPPTLKGVRFAQTHRDREILAIAQRQICDALARLGVAAMPDRIEEVKPSRIRNHAGEARWTGGISIVDSLEFAERVGFRYCAHKTTRLSAAAAYWRLKRTVNAQRVAVAKRALATVGVVIPAGPKPVWSHAVAGAYEQVAAAGPVLSPYYASFAGTKRVSKQVLVNTVEGQKSTEPRLRRTNRRVLAAAVGRGGATTGVPGVKDFFAEIGAQAWFNNHTPRGNSYKVTYAVAQDAFVEPTFQLGVVDVRPAGEHEVYDLTVDELHSFVANGAVVHNCIPHGGGGPGMGPIAAKQHLAPYLPGHPLAASGSQAVGPVSAAPWGSASILPISFAYIAMMGEPGLRRATEVAILNANYIAKKLGAHYPVLYTGQNGRVAHELILDCRQFKKSSGIEAEDIAKRLMDYGFHAPTMSFPVPGTLMIEPTESENKAELDRFCDAMIAIRTEIAAIESGAMDRTNNPLKNAPHTAAAVTGTEWDRPYSREQAAFPAPWLRVHKYWPPVGRVDNAYGDRNLVCACPPVDAYG